MNYSIRYRTGEGVNRIRTIPASSKQEALDAFTHAYQYEQILFVVAWRSEKADSLSTCANCSHDESEHGSEVNWFCHIGCDCKQFISKN